MSKRASIVKWNETAIVPCENISPYKGQLISKCPYEMTVSSKIPT